MPNTNPTSDINPHDIYDYLKDDIDVFCNNVPSLVNDIITQYNIDINSEYNPLCDPIVIQSYIANHIKELLSDLHQLNPNIIVRVVTVWLRFQREKVLEHQ